MQSKGSTALSVGDDLDVAIEAASTTCLRVLVQNFRTVDLGQQRARLSGGWCGQCLDETLSDPLLVDVVPERLQMVEK